LSLSLGRGPGHSPFAPIGLIYAIETHNGSYSRAAFLVAPYLGPNTVVASPEIGVLGYITRGHILDTVGLVSPGVMRYYPRPRELGLAYVIPPIFIQGEHPDFIVALNGFFPEQLLQAGWFTREYRLREAFPVTYAGHKEMLVYERVGPSPRR
jgi:hypothetical protein